jgi:hypothetical protein
MIDPAKQTIRDFCLDSKDDQPALARHRRIGKVEDHALAAQYGSVADLVVTGARTLVSIRSPKFLQMRGSSWWAAKGLSRSKPNCDAVMPSYRHGHGQ